MSGEKHRVVGFPDKGIFRNLFIAAQFMIPLTAGGLILASVLCVIDLSWQLLALTGIGLLPFLLPLVCVYVGKIWEIELNAMSRQGIIPEAEMDAADCGTQAPTVSMSPTPTPTPSSTPAPSNSLPSAIPSGPDPNALTMFEKKMLRTLWKHQSRYVAEQKPTVWGFAVGPNRPDYPEFARGFNTLFERGLVRQNERGLVYLTKAGIEYCRIFSNAIDMDGDAWTQFAPGE